MSEPLCFDEVSYLLGSSERLPEIPSGPLQLSTCLESNNADTREIERIVLSDPALTAGVLRAASSSLFGRQKPVTTAREAIMVMGLRTLRSLSMAMYTRALVCQSRHQSSFDPERFGWNGNFVGTLANLTFKELFGLAPAYRWNADELFVGGVLHNVMFGLLSYTAPDEFERIYALAEEEQVDLRAAFRMIHEHDLSILAPRAAGALCLPEMFAAMIQGLEAPGGYPKEESVPYVVLSFAVRAAEAEGISLTQWKVEAAQSESVDTLLNLDENAQVRLLEEAKQKMHLTGMAA